MDLYSCNYFCRSQRKDELTNGARRQQKQQKSEVELRKHEEMLDRKQESSKAYVAWKNKKEDIVKGDVRLKDDSKARLHPTAWCPARSMQYNYPGSNVRVKTIRSVSAGSVRSYSTASVRSDTLSSVEESRTESPRGKLKTIHVCCQTLEYWCTCDDH